MAVALQERYGFLIGDQSCEHDAKVCRTSSIEHCMRTMISFTGSNMQMICIAFRVRTPVAHPSISSFIICRYSLQ